MRCSAASQVGMGPLFYSHVDVSRIAADWATRRLGDPYVALLHQWRLSLYDFRGDFGAMVSAQPSAVRFVADSSRCGSNPARLA